MPIQIPEVLKTHTPGSTCKLICDIVITNPCIKHNLMHCTECGPNVIKKSFMLKTLLRHPFKNLRWSRIIDYLETPPGITFHTSTRGLSTKQWAQFVQVYLLANLSSAVAASSVLNTSNAGQTIASSNSIGTIQIVAGTNGGASTAAAFTDYKLVSQSSGSSGFIAAAMTTISGNTFTVTGTITNSSGATINYNEVGMYFTANSQVFDVAHDAPLNGSTGFPVSSPSGTMQVTYTYTWT